MRARFVGLDSFFLQRKASKFAAGPDANSQGCLAFSEHSSELALISLPWKSEFGFESWKPPDLQAEELFFRSSEEDR